MPQPLWTGMDRVGDHQIARRRPRPLQVFRLGLGGQLQGVEVLPSQVTDGMRIKGRLA